MFVHFSSELSRLLTHSCLVPECDDANAPQYDQPWVLHTVPGTHKGANIFVPDQCRRFDTEMDRSNATQFTDACPSDWFTDRTIDCDRWVFESGERTIVNDVRNGEGESVGACITLLWFAVFGHVPGEPVATGAHWNAALCRHRRRFGRLRCDGRQVIWGRQNQKFRRLSTTDLFDICVLAIAPSKDTAAN